MSVMRHGYGSEWHLRSLLSTKPENVSSAILSELAVLGVPSASEVVWESSYLKVGEPELCGLEFLDPSSPARQEWRNWWPQTGNVHNWDAVGTVRHNGHPRECLLVEAKANLQEVRSNCGAEEHGGLPKIRGRLRETQLAVGLKPERDWTKGHYQYANRLALLHFLRSQAVPARLVFIYFCGDYGDDRRNCPRSRDGWKPTLAAMKEHLGLRGESELEQHVHEVFITVENPNQ